MIASSSECSFRLFIYEASLHNRFSILYGPDIDFVFSRFKHLGLLVYKQPKRCRKLNESEMKVKLWMKTLP